MRYTSFILVALFLSTTIPTQGQVNVAFNLGSQPVWGPTGYDYVEYYYLPDIETYYYVPSRRYYYYNDGRWINTASLPSRYVHYDVYNSYKVVVNEKQPWHNHKSYRAKYVSYKGRRGQTMIRDSRDPKYFVIKGHPEHPKWIKQQKMKKSNNGSKAVQGNKNNGNKMQKGNNSANNGKSNQMQKNTKGGKGKY